jgi:hypothetical protein
MLVTLRINIENASKLVTNVSMNPGAARIGWPSPAPP